ncbi:unnamed protein product, partial [Owenia fusiformis]
DVNKVMATDSNKDASLHLIEAMLKTTSHGGWFFEFIIALRETERSLANTILTRNLQLWLGTLKEKIQVDSSLFMASLRSDGVISMEDEENIRAGRERYGPSHAAWVLLERLHKKKETWFMCFLKALDENGDKSLVRDLYPDYYKQQLENDYAPPKIASKLAIVDVSEKSPIATNTPIAKRLNSKENLDNSPHDTQSRRQDNIPSTSGEEGDKDEKHENERSEKEIEDGKQELREYQRELAGDALRGNNVVVCAPTGCGKTRVSMHVVKNHLKDTETGTSACAAPSGRRARKVVFMTKTVPLAQQQYDNFISYLPDYQTYKICGDDDEREMLNDYMHQYDIFVLTPQILENHLEKESVKISDFSLFVFDECHHATKEDVYNKIMYRYRKLKLQKAKDLPQILGLTASLGVGRSKNDKEAQEHIKGVLANLDCAAIATVEKNLDELKRFVSCPEQEIFPVNLPKENDPFAKDINTIMRGIEAKMFKEPLAWYVDDIPKIPTDRASQTYEQWIVNLKKVMAENTDENDEKSVQIGRLVEICTTYLREYYRALDIHKTARIKDAHKYLIKAMREIKTTIDKNDNDEYDLLKQYTEEYLPKFTEYSKDSSFTNPKLEQVKSILLGAFQEKGDSSRGILFVKTRASTIALYDWITEDEDFGTLDPPLNPRRFTGAGAREEEGGLTQADQDGYIEEFRNGTCRLLVATSVAEEGLDIPECNIVIRYDYVTNEIAMVQAKGRNRAKGGTTFLVGDTKHTKKESLNLVREAMMGRAIKEIKNIKRERLKREIGELQTKDVKMRDLEQLRIRRTKRQKKQGDYKVICAKCKELAFYSSDIRTINEKSYVVVSKDIRQKIEERPHKRQGQAWDGIQKKAKIHHKGRCGFDWGIMATYMGSDLPMIKIEQFVVVSPSGEERKRSRKWIDVPFQVLELDIEKDFIPENENDDEVDEEPPIKVEED